MLMGQSWQEDRNVGTGKKLYCEDCALHGDMFIVKSKLSRSPNIAFQNGSRRVNLTVYSLGLDHTVFVKLNFKAFRERFPLYHTTSPLPIISYLFYTYVPELLAHEGLCV